MTMRPVTPYALKLVARTNNENTQQHTTLPFMERKGSMLLATSPGC